MYITDNSSNGSHKKPVTLIGVQIRNLTSFMFILPLALVVVSSPLIPLSLLLIYPSLDPLNRSSRPLPSSSSAVLSVPFFPSLIFPSPLHLSYSMGPAAAPTCDSRDRGCAGPAGVPEPRLHGVG